MNGKAEDTGPTARLDADHILFRRHQKRLGVRRDLLDGLDLQQRVAVVIGKCARTNDPRAQRLKSAEEFIRAADAGHREDGASGETLRGGGVQLCFDDWSIEG